MAHCAVDQRCQERHPLGDPTLIGGRVDDAVEVDDAYDYTLLPDWAWKDDALGPFVVATMGTFIATLIKYRADAKSPAFILAVVGAGLWGTGFVMQMCNMLEFRSTTRARLDISARAFGYCIAVIAVVLAGMS